MSGTTNLNHLSVSILSDSVSVAQEFLNRLLNDINKLPRFSEINPHTANQLISSLSMEIGSFVEITTLITQMLQRKLNMVLLGAKNSHIHLLFIMKGINQMQSKNDLLALEDLIKYELKDNLTQWKIDLIPQTKRAIQASASF